MLKRMLISTMALCAMLPGLASAELVEYDWKQEGDGLVSYDLNTGLLWLDLTVTKNYSIDDMKDAINNDARFAGWRLPSYAEMRELASGLFEGVSAVSGDAYKVRHTKDEWEAHAIMGQNIGNFTYGLYDNNGSSMLFGSGYPDGVYFDYLHRESLNFRRDYEGVYLVTNELNSSIDALSIQTASAVSSPLLGGGALLTLCAAGLVRRKTKDA